MLENPITGERIVFESTAASSGGELLRFELFFRPRGFVTAEHVQPRQSEKHEVLSGALGIVVEGRERKLGPGESVVVPAGVRHRLFPVGEGLAHTRFELRPALRSEELIETFFHLARDGKVWRRGYPNPLRLALIVREYGADEGHPTRPPLVVQRAAAAALAPLARLLGYRARA